MSGIDVMILKLLFATKNGEKMAKKWRKNGEKKAKKWRKNGKKLLFLLKLLLVFAKKCYHNIGF
jgi:hypothetical protein